MKTCCFKLLSMIADEEFFFFFLPGRYVQIASPTSGGSFLHNNAAYYCAINGIVMASATQGERSAAPTLPPPGSDIQSALNTPQ